LKFKPDSGQSKFLILRNSVLTELNFCDTLPGELYKDVINKKEATIHFNIFNRFSTMEDLIIERKITIDSSLY